MGTEDLIREALKSADTYPTGPVSAWPKERAEEVIEISRANAPNKEAFDKMMADAKVKHQAPQATRVRANPRQMVKSFFQTSGQAIRNGRVSEEIREERYDTCKGCPKFIEESKRCSECGCFMEAKTWVGGDPDLLCPLKKWSR